MQPYVAMHLVVGVPLVAQDCVQHILADARQHLVVGLPLAGLE